MPCNGITVWKFRELQKEKFSEKRAELITLLRGLRIIEEKQLSGGIEITVLLGNLPCKVKIYLDGRIEAITQQGSFLQGKEAIKGTIQKALRVQGQYESHRHTHFQGPLLAYGTAQRL